MELLALVVLLLSGVALQKLLYRKRGFSRLEYTCYFSQEEAQEGDEVFLVEELSNRKWLPLPWLKAEITSSKWLDFADAQSIVTDQTRYVSSYFVLKSYHKIQRRWKVRCKRRGVFRLDHVVLVASDLLGGLSLSQSVPAAACLTVLPRSPEADWDLLFRNLTGERAVRRNLIPDPYTFAGVREFQRGDSTRNINWRATARTGLLMVTERESAASQNLAVILNMQSREFEGPRIADSASVENAIRAAASCLRSAVWRNLPVRLYTNGVAGEQKGLISEAGSGPEHLDGLLRLLAALEDSTSERFADYLARIAERVDCAAVVIVSCFFNGEILRMAEELRQRGAQVLFAAAAPVPLEWSRLPGMYDLSGHFQEDEHETLV